MSQTVKQSGDTVPQTPAAGNGHGAIAGAGAPSDLGSAFAGALLSAVRREESTASDAHMAGALGLGWYLAALAHPGGVSETAAAARGDLTGVAALVESELVDFCHTQVKVTFAKLGDLVAKAGLALPDLTELDDSIDTVREQARRTAAGRVDAEAPAVLSAVEFRLGKAYGLGRALMNLTTRPSPRARLAAHLTTARIAPVVAAIDDLSSALPAHAGHSVRASLLEWQASIEGHSSVAPEARETWLQLARQGELWRTLLTGEKSGTHMLEIDDYLDAAERLSKRMRTVALRLVMRFPEAAVAVVLLFAVGVAIVALTDRAAAIAAGASTIVASLGLTWRGLGRSLGGLAGKLERPLWGAELDTAIMQAITLLEREQGRDVAGERRKVAVALGEPAPEDPTATT